MPTITEPRITAPDIAALRRAANGLPAGLRQAAGGLPFPVSVPNFGPAIRPAARVAFKQGSTTSMGFVGQARIALIGVSLLSGVLALTGIGTIQGIGLAVLGAAAQGGLTLIETVAAYSKKGTGAAMRAFARGAALTGFSLIPFGAIAEKIGWLGKGAQALQAARAAKTAEAAAKAAAEGKTFVTVGQAASMGGHVVSTAGGMGGGIVAEKITGDPNAPEVVAQAAANQWQNRIRAQRGLSPLAEGQLPAPANDLTPQPIMRPANDGNAPAIAVPPQRIVGNSTAALAQRAANEQRELGQSA